MAELRAGIESGACGSKSLVCDSMYLTAQVYVPVTPWRGYYQIKSAPFPPVAANSSPTYDQLLGSFDTESSFENNFATSRHS